MFNLQSFFEKEQFGIAHIDAARFRYDFANAMASGLKTQVQHMLMIPAWLSLPDKTPIHEPVLVIDMGGSNVRVALVSFNEVHDFVIHQFEQHKMPGIGAVCSKEAFLNQLIEFVKPFWGKSKRIGLCFSYEMDILPNHDGRIVKFSKEVQVPEMEGECLGEAFKAALRAAGMDDDVQIAMLNDTVACLLGGYAVRQNPQSDGAIGLILGTGINTAYVEQTHKIEKLTDAYQHDQMIINMESGGYNIQDVSDIDRELDEHSQHPGEHLFEKMISGRYIGDIGQILLRRAAEQELFDEATKQALLHHLKDAPLTTLDMDVFLVNPWGDNSLARICYSDEARDRMVLLCKEVFARAAYLTALELSVLLESTDTGKHPSRPVLVCVEGSTYSKSKWVKPYMFSYIHQILMDQFGRYIDLIEVENSNLMGAALAAYSI